jgi:hypothetical protein
MIILERNTSKYTNRNNCHDVINECVRKGELGQLSKFTEKLGDFYIRADHQCNTEFVGGHT